MDFIQVCSVEFYNRQTTCKDCLKKNQNGLYTCEICNAWLKENERKKNMNTQIGI